VTAVCFEPDADLFGVEADEVTPLDEWDAPLGDEAANMPNVDVEVLRQVDDVEQLRQSVVGIGGCHDTSTYAQ
jgi:hypothetical protein